MTVAIETRTEIRQGTAADLPVVLSMFRQFIQTDAYRRYIGDSPRHAERMLTYLLTDPDATVFLSEQDGTVIGMLGLMTFSQPMSGEWVAQEIFWWLDPAHRGYGGWLLKRGEKWAREKGALRMQMMAPADNGRVMETYEALGYRRVEVIFQKDLR